MSKDKPQEASLIERAKALEPKATHALLVEYSPVVYHYFLRMGLNGVCAEELSQETFRRVWTSLPSFQGESLLKTWILCIARRVAYQHFAKESAQPLLLSFSDSIEQLSEWWKSSEPDPEQALLIAESKYTVEQLLIRLPADEREVVILHGLEELSQRDIAELMDRSVGWVNKVWQRACGRMKRLLLASSPSESPESNVGYWPTEFRNP